MRSILRIISLLILYALFGRAIWAQSSPEDILQRLSKKYISMPALRISFSYELKQAALDFSDKVHGVAVLQREMYRIDFGDQRIFCDGSSIWTYIPELKEVTVTSSSPESALSLEQLFQIYQNDYIYRVLSKNGAVSLLELTPENKKDELFKIQVHLNTERMNLIKSQLFYKDGSRHIYTIKELQSQKKEPVNAFRFTPPKGVEVIDLR